MNILKECRDTPEATRIKIERRQVAKCFKSVVQTLY